MRCVALQIQLSWLNHPSQSIKTRMRSRAMSATAAARQSAATSSLRDRLKDPSLLRDRCYIDGAWTGTPANPVTNPANGVELAKVPKLSTAEATQAGLVTGVA